MSRVVNKIYSVINGYALNGFRRDIYGGVSDIYTWKYSLSSVAEKWLDKMPIVPITEKYKHPFIAKVLRLNRNGSINPAFCHD